MSALTILWCGAVQHAVRAVGRFDTPLGVGAVMASETAVTGLSWGQEDEEVEFWHAASTLAEPLAQGQRHAGRAAVALVDMATSQLAEYFAGSRCEFDIPLELAGTTFQQDVWNYLCQIPYGETRSYRDVAQAIGRGKAVRAVGQANRANPIAIIVPCHRVIGIGGALTGYAGSRVHLKAGLLELERSPT